MNPEIPPFSLPDETPMPTKAKRGVAHWRWWVATILIGSSPVLGSLLGGARRADEETIMIPKDVVGLLLFCALQFALFGVVWGIAWAFARADRDELLLRVRGFWKAIGWGLLYSLGMRCALAFAMVFVLMILAILGLDVEKLVKIAQENGQGAQKAFAPAMANSSLLYKFLMISLVSFVVAGLREELWRTFTLAGLKRIFPQHWDPRAKNVFAVVFSSVLFGLGHVYQGLTGVVITTVLGFALGAIVLRHKSIWPAVVAHGCFNAVSFIGLAMLKPGN